MIDLIKIKKEKLEKSRIYPLNSFIKTKTYENTDFIVPCFCNNNLKSTSMIRNVFDIILEISYRNKEFGIICTCNGKRIKKDKAKEFLNMYIMEINSLIDQYCDVSNNI